jgi:hypothetical protein
LERKLRYKIAKEHTHVQVGLDNRNSLAVPDTVVGFDEAADNPAKKEMVP